MARLRSNSTSESSVVLKAALALGGAGAVVILLPLLGDGAAIAGLVAIIAGTVLAAAQRLEPGREHSRDRGCRDLAARGPRVVEHHRGGDLRVLGRGERGEPGV